MTTKTSNEPNIKKCPNITPATLIELEKALVKLGREYHVEVVVKSGMLLKTIDNESNARITIENINKKLAGIDTDK